MHARRDTRWRLARVRGTAGPDRGGQGAGAEARRQSDHWTDSQARRSIASSVGRAGTGRQTNAGSGVSPWGRRLFTRQVSGCYGWSPGGDCLRGSDLAVEAVRDEFPSTAVAQDFAGSVLRLLLRTEEAARTFRALFSNRPLTVFGRGDVSVVPSHDPPPAVRPVGRSAPVLRGARLLAPRSRRTLRRVTSWFKSPAASADVPEVCASVAPRHHRVMTVRHPAGSTARRCCPGDRAARGVAGHRRARQDAVAGGLPDLSRCGGTSGTWPRSARVRSDRRPPCRTDRPGEQPRRRAWPGRPRSSPRLHDAAGRMHARGDGSFPGLRPREDEGVGAVHQIEELVSVMLTLV